MRLRFIYLVLASASVALAGCASTGRQTVLPEAAPQGAQQSTANQGSEVVAGVNQVAPEEPTGNLELGQVLALALLGNPELAVFAYGVRAAEAQALQAGLLPNPQLEIEIGEYDRDGEGFDSSEATVQLGQLFELGRKRHWRVRMAEIEGELAGWDYESKRLDVLTSTAQYFIAVVAAQQRLELAQSTVELAEQTSQAVTARVQAGKEPMLQASKAAAELEMARLGVVEAGNDLDVSRRRLASMWGSEQPRFQTVEGDLGTVLDSIPTMEMLRPGLSGSPALARWEAELRLRLAVLSSETAARVPDLQASVGLQRFREDDTDSVTFGIGVPLPLFNRNQGNIAAARLHLERLAAEKKSIETALALELATAHATLTAAHKKAMTLQAKVVPAMQEASEAAHEGYEQGKFGFLEMLDSQRGLFTARGKLLNALSAYHTAAADIQKITGTSLAPGTGLAHFSDLSRRSEAETEAGGGQGFGEARPTRDVPHSSGELSGTRN